MNKIEKDTLCFRRMIETDLDSVLMLEAEGHVVPWGREIFQDCLRAGYYCALLEYEKLFLAYAVMSVAAREAHILNVCVNKKYQRQGFGLKSVTHLMEVAKHNKVNTMFLEVRPSNEIAINLYESLGFLEIGQRKNYYPTGSGSREDALVMAKELREFWS